MKNRSFIIACAVALVAAIFIILFANRNAPPPAGQTETVQITPNEAASQQAPVSPPVNPQTKTNEEEPEPSVPAGHVHPSDGSAPNADEPPPMDPEDQPRTFYVLDFENSGPLPADYSLTNLEWTAEGIEIADSAPERPDGSRVGYLDSPPVAMDFPSNAQAPLWKENLPDGTRIEMDIAFSPDGQEWTEWMHVDPYTDADSEIREFYPDGSPNPNYGYTPGGLMVHGMNQFTHFRYRMELSTSNDDSPVLRGVRIYYQDSTMGQGRIAEVKEVKQE